MLNLNTGCGAFRNQFVTWPTNHCDIYIYICDNCVIMWCLPQFCGRHQVVKQLKSKTPKACYMMNMQICTMLLVSPWFISPAWNTRSDNYFRDALFQWSVSISNWSCGNNILIEMSWGMMGLHSFECVMFADCFVILWHAMLLSNRPAWRNMGIYAIHDDVIKWKHLPRYWPFVREIHRSPVNYPHKGQWRGALMFSVIRVWIIGWINNR